MAEIRPAEISEILKQEIKGFEARVDVRETGRVLSCAEIRRATPSWAAVDDHAIEMAVSRLRRTLHDGQLIQTVMRRGYRLAG